jgi:hypothetical protein
MRRSALRSAGFDVRELMTATVGRFRGIGPVVPETGLADDVRVSSRCTEVRQIMRSVPEFNSLKRGENTAAVSGL